MSLKADRGWVLPEARTEAFRASAAVFVGVLVFWMAEGPVLAKPDQYPGVVVKVDTSNSYIVVMNPRTGARVRFTMTDKLTITENEEAKAITDLVAGTLVIVEYEQLGEQYIARHISIQPASK